MGCSRQSTTYARIRIEKQSTRSYDNETDLCICKLEARLKEAFQISHGGIMFGHRGVNDTLDKFQRTFFVLLQQDKIKG